ncbi:MAG: 2-keto-4-pentenoate hydratase [Candidatus Limnocylindrales bacterium]
MSTVDQMSEVLRLAEQSRSAVGPVSDLVAGGLTLDMAHAVCEANIQKRLDAGERLVGYKVGSTNARVRQAMGLPGPTYGYLLDNMVVLAGGELLMKELISPRIESEICFRMRTDLQGPDLTIEQVLDATDAVSAAFEVCDSRIKDWKCPYPDWFADNGFAARIVLPGRWVPVRKVDLSREAVFLTKDSHRIAEGTGEMVMGNPANAVVWLARSLHERGRSLSAGMLVMTGTITPVTPIEQGSAYSASFSTLGSVQKTFV